MIDQNLLTCIEFETNVLFEKEDILNYKQLAKIKCMYANHIRKDNIK